MIRSGHLSLQDFLPDIWSWSDAYNEGNGDQGWLAM
jgi:hypothetical protein